MEQQGYLSGGDADSVQRLPELSWENICVQFHWKEKTVKLEIRTWHGGPYCILDGVTKLETI